MKEGCTRGKERWVREEKGRQEGDKGGEEGDGARRKGKKEGDVKKILMSPNNNKF